MYSEDVAGVGKIPGNQDGLTDYFGGEVEVEEFEGPLSVNDRFSNIDRRYVKKDWERKHLGVPAMDDESDGERFFSDVLRDFVKSNGRNIPDSSLLQNLAEGMDTLARINVLDEINDVVLSAFGYAQKENAHQLSTALLPSVLFFLTDETKEVRRKSSLLLSTFMQYSLDKTIIEKEICPAVLEVSDPLTGIDLMGKLAFYLDEEIVEKFFLEKFIVFCSSDSVYTREVCAANFGNICEGLWKETTEKKLLPVFIELCRDSNRAVRMSCAENFMAVTCNCSLEIRKKVLAPVFADLLVDSFQLVRVMSYRILGAFICTFADPTISGLQCERNGEINFDSRDGLRFSFRSPKRDEISHCMLLSRHFRIVEEDPGHNKWEHRSLLASFFEENRLYREFKSREGLSFKEKVVVIKEDPEYNSSGGDNIAESKDEESGWNNSEDSSSSSSSSDESDKKVDDAYNTFRFWRTPLLETDLLDLEPEQDEIGNNLNLLDNELTKLSDKLDECSTKINLEGIKNESVISSASTPDSGWNSASTTPPKSNVFGDSLKENNLSDILYGKRPGGKEDDPRRRGHCAYVPNQEVVPQLLLDHFVSMTEPFHAGETDKEMAQHCAYFLPAVALTLGPDNWIFLRKTYKCLAADIQLKVQKTMASSIHELASILGEDLASKDLVPIFRGFLRDLDEVRIGVLEHLADFLKYLDSDTRNMLLPLLKEILKTDNDQKWRYREELGEQMRLLINLFSPVDCLKHLAPMTTCLLCDKVAVVRQKGVQLMSDLLVYLSDESHFQIALLDHLVEEFAENPVWRLRQVFVHLCSELARQNVLDCETFATMMLGHLLKLSEDSISNIQLCVARCLSIDIINSGYISPDSLHYKLITETLESLKKSDDRDVRYYAGAQEEEEEEEQGDTSSFNNSWDTNYSPFSAEYQIADSTRESTDSSESYENSPIAPAVST